MATPNESRLALTLVQGAAVENGGRILAALRGGGNLRRAALLGSIPDLIAAYSDGTSALAADFYEDQREQANASGRFAAEPIVLDRNQKIRNGVAWAAAPLVADEADELLAGSRLAEVISLEVARPYRDTILTNRRRDPQAVGWRRNTRANGCKFCQMLAAKGAVYKKETARFAAHPNCSCTAVPVFLDGREVEEASALQYVASERRRNDEEKAVLRDYLNTYFPGAPG